MLEMIVTILAVMIVGGFITYHKDLYYIYKIFNK